VLEMAHRAAIDAVAASWTAGAEKDGLARSLADAD